MTQYNKQCQNYSPQNQWTDLYKMLLFLLQTYFLITHFCNLKTLQLLIALPQNVFHIWQLNKNKQGMPFVRFPDLVHKTTV